MRCPSCGNENREGARFCDACGTDLTRAAGASPESEPERSGEQAARVGELPAGSPSLIAGRYEVTGFLGRGGRKRVYLARDREAGDRELAIAVFETAGIGETAVARARREAQAMERLGNHPRIAAVLASGEHEGAPYLASEYMSRGDLGTLLADSDRGRLAPERAIAIAADVCRALEHAHGHGIIHRDLKPANVWIGDDDRARLGDFGLAATERRSREAGSLIGTVAYLPPEQALGRAVDARADLYSLGALLYEMVTGQPPFSGDDALTVIGRHVNSEPVPPRKLEPSLPPALDRLILSLLAKAPDDRPASAAAVRGELEAIAANPDAGEEPEAEDPVEALAGGAIVGRDPELERMRAAVDDALGGRGGLLFVVGEPGIGKTRSAEELATYARVRGAKVLWGRSHEGERAPAFWPWIEAIREFVREADPVGLRWQLGARGPELARIVREIAELLGVEPDAGGVEDEHGRFRLFDAVAGFLADAARARPLVIVLEDLHWADASSIELLGFVSRQIGEAGLLIVGTYRDVELGRQHMLSSTLGELAAADRTQTIALQGLDAAGVAAMIEVTTGTAPSAALVRAIWERTEGNPFFVGEVVRMLAAAGELETAKAELPVIVPQGVRDTVTLRLAALTPEANEILRVAAVFGREFEPPVIEAASGRSAGEVAGALGEALEAGVLIDPQAPGECLCFGHAIVRETLYAEIEEGERAQLHRRLGEAIERVHGDDLPSHVADLARHFALAVDGDAEKAIEYACRAGEQAVSQLAHEDAAVHYARALELAEGVGAPAERRIELALSLGQARTLAGRFAEAREAYEAAARLARELGDAEALTKAALGANAVAVAGRVDEPLLAMIEEALEANGDADSVVRVELLSAVAQRVIWRDPQGEASEAGREALEIARRLGDDYALATALANQQFLVTAQPDSPRLRLANAEELIEVAERSGDADLAIRGYAFRLHSLLELGDVRRAEEEAFAGYARVASELRQPHHLWHLPLFRAVRATMEGDFVAAEELAAEARSGGERAQEPLAGQLHALQMAVIRQVQGRLEEAVPAVREMARRFPAIRAWRLTLASFLAELGSEDEARAEFERHAADDFTQVPRDLQWLPAMIRLADAAFWLGDGKRAAILHEMIEPFAGLAVVVGRAASCQGPVDLYLARLALAMGHPSDAVAHAEAACELARRMHDRTFLYESQFALGRALDARGRPRDRERALEELTASLDGADSIGMRRLVERALAARLEVQGLADIDVLTSIEAVVEAVGSERPDLSALAAGDGTLTILFSDIENSTLINERLGDARWLEVLREHNAIFRDRLADFGGYEVKSQGDGFMLAFAEPIEALEFAVAVQDDLAASDASGSEEISVRMGMHTGEAIAEEGDLFGRSVVLAARIAAQAIGGEILVSEALATLCRDAGGERYSFGSSRELELKGLAGTHTVLRVEAMPATSSALA